MRKERLLLLPLCIGLALVCIAWRQSYPVSIGSASDYPFNHISPLYWIGVAVLLGTLYIMASELKNSTLRWIAVLGIVTSMYSLSYFFYLLPGSDSHHTRGLTEYFITNRDLDPNKSGHYYFQWPSLFILCNIATDLIGLELKYFEFILYVVIGFLCTTSLYSYFSRISRDGGVIAVIAFFILFRYRFSYQFAPFSLCLGLLFLLFMIDSRDTTSRVATSVVLIIYASMTFIHPFLSVFMILYMLVKYFLSKEKKYLTLFTLTLIIYLAVITFYTVSFPMAIRLLTTRSQEYEFAIATTTVEPVDPIDTIAQMLANTTLIVTAIVSGLGFMILLLGRKLRYTDHAIFTSGILYLAAGAFIYILGMRALYIAAIPVSFGATYFLKTKFRKHYKVLFFILTILFAFVIVHKSYSQKWFQTRDDYRSANFFVKFYNLSKSEHILSDVTINDYIQPKISRYAVFEDGYSSPPQDLETYDCIIYTAGLERSLVMWNYSVGTELHKIEENFNIVFNSGFSFTATHVNTSKPQ